MNKPVITESNAERDIAEAYNWYECRRPDLGEEFLVSIERAIELIGERPRSFPIVRRTARRVLVRRFPYLILFVEKPDHISVVGVFHTSRDPKHWGERL